MALTQVDQGLLGTYAQYTAFKNRIINGAMQIDQRNAGASVTPVSLQYTLDRWFHQLSQASKISVQRSTTAPEGFTNSALITSLSAYSITASDYFNIVQRIEGFNVSDLGWGTVNAKSITVSFWVRSSLTGTFGGSVLNTGQTRSYPFTYTINSANTFEQKTITIAGDTSGTWLTDSGVGIGLSFGLGCGSTYSGTAGSWAGATYLSATGATSVVGTNGATFYITGVQLEKGSTATSFDYRPYGTERQLAQRYYYQCWGDGGMSATGNAFLGVAVSNVLTVGIGSAIFPVSMRTAPTVTTYDDSGTSGKVSQPGYSNGITAPAVNIGINGFSQVNSSTNFTGGTPIRAYFKADAEL